MTALITNLPKLSSDYISKSTKRDISTDIARGFAILLMIQVHLFILVPYNGDLNYLNSLMSPAPFFLIMSGLSYEFFFKSRLTKYNHEKIIFFEIIYRALILVSIDMLALLVGSVLWPSLYNFTIYWGVIQIIAFGYIFGYFFPKDFKSKIFSTVGLTFLMIIFNLNLSNNPILFDLSVTLLPGLIYFQSGRIIHDLLTLESNKNYLASLSSLLLICNLLLIYLFNINIFSEWIAVHRWESPTIFIIINNVFILTVLIQKVIYKYSCLSLFLNPIERLGKIAFTVYFAHVGLLFAISTFTLKFLPDVVIPSSFLLQFCILILFLVFFSTIEKYWSNYEYLFGFEWLLRKGSKLMLEFTQKWLYKNHNYAETGK